ncbi:MAG: hypothetical protein JWO13_1360 [Acidobacteriales bacterium]|nr:hypothetical protein [Terriglobales bacterium]
MYNARDAKSLDDLTEEESELKERHGLTDGQIAYRREIRANFGVLAKQEYAEDAESCFLRSGDCHFDVDAIDKRMLELALPGVEAATMRHDVTIFVPPREGREYIIGVDSAGGGSDGDYACAQVIDRKSGMQCAELHGHLSPLELARKVAKLAEEYQPALLAVERNNQGGEVIVHLRSMSSGAIFSHNGREGLLTTSGSRKEIVAVVSVAESESL